MNVVGEKWQQTTRKGGKQVEDEGNVICQSQLRNSMQLLEEKNMHGWNNAKKLVRWCSVKLLTYFNECEFNKRSYSSFIIVICKMFRILLSCCFCF